MLERRCDGRYFRKFLLNAIPGGLFPGIDSRFDPEWQFYRVN